jgi:predicted ATPase
VFISYASVDRDRVLSLVGAVRESGIEAWVDQADITGGVSYGPEITAGIKDSRALVLMCSAASLASRNVAQEIQLAWRFDRPILPLLLEPVTFPDELVYWLEGAQWIETFGAASEAWLGRLRQALVARGFPIGSPGIQPASPEPAPPIDLPPNNLPTRLAPILGRDRELRRLLALANNGRLVTITGTGGVGKTRLAIEAARRLAPAFAGGTWLVDAAADQSATALARTISSTLGVSEEAGESVLDSVLRHLRDAETLLVLDNLEQIRDAGELVSELLAQTSRLKVIATSRAAVRVTGEMVFPLGGLDIPSSGAELSAVAAAQHPAVALFVDRARQARPDFALSDGNVHEILAICARLEGLPLAIELAAARVRLLPPAAILDRLDQSLALLTRGAATLNDRQRTLRSTIAWSYDLLDPPGQLAFERLSVFAGGCPVDAAEAAVDDPSALDLIDDLIDQHLLQADSNQSDEPRLRMLETIREFALERLRARGDEEATRQRHAEWFREFAKSAFAHLEEGANPELLDRLERDRANLRAAIECFAEQGRGGAGDLEMADALWRFWWMRGHLDEGLAALTGALARNPDAPLELRGSAMTSAAVIAETRGEVIESARILDDVIGMVEGTEHRRVLARALSGRGKTAEIVGELDLASDCFERALAIYRELDHERGIAVTLHSLSSVMTARGEYDQAEPLAAQALDVWRKRGEMQSLAYTLQQLGIATYYQGKYERAAELYQETVAIAESLGDRLGQGNGLLNWGSALEMSGHLDASIEKYNEALPLFEAIQDTGGIGYIHYQIGHVRRTQGDLPEARERLLEAIRYLGAVGDRPSLALVLETLAGAELDSGRPALAAQLLGAAESLREQTGAAIPATRIDEVQRDRSAAAEALGASRFAAEIEQGRLSDAATIVAGLTP